MTPEQKFLQAVKEWRDSCKEAHEEGLKKDVYDLGFHLTYKFLDKAIKDYENETIPEC